MITGEGFDPGGIDVLMGELQFQLNERSPVEQLAILFVQPLARGERIACGASKQRRGDSRACAGPHQDWRQFPTVVQKVGNDAGLPPATIAASGENQGVDAVQAQMSLMEFHADL